MSDERQFVPRRHPRFAVAESRVLFVTIQSGSGSESCILLDISRGGAQLACKSAPSFLQEPVTLSLRGAQTALNVMVSARLCWCRPDERHGSLIGMEFVPEMPEEVFRPILEEALAQRRADRRLRANLNATAHWVNDETEFLRPFFRVVVRDVSQGGVCLLAPSAGAIGSVLRVRLNDTKLGMPEFDAQLRWQAQFRSGYLLGCRFLDRGHFEPFRTLFVD